MVEETAVGWQVGVRLRPGRVSFVGRLGSAHAHAHAAVQVMVLTEGRARLTDGCGGSRDVAAAVIPAGARHELHAPDATGVMIYLDPAGRDARALTALSAGAQTVDAWEAAAGPAPRPSRATGPELADEVVAALVGPPAPPPRDSVRAALDLLPGLTGGPIRLGQVAAAVGLSPSRLRHLFAADLGLPFTACVRWARLRTAMVTVRDGGTLTDAAHAAGFADSAHLTRVFHAMFGLAPSTALRRLDWH